MWDRVLQVGVNRQRADALAGGDEERIRPRRANRSGSGLAGAAGSLGVLDQVRLDYRASSIRNGR
jgi:hypothetical protein